MKAKKVIVTCGICLVMLALLSGCFGTCIEVIQISISGISQCAYIAKNGQFPEEEFETKIIYSDDEKFVFNFGDIGFNSYVYVNGEKKIWKFSLFPAIYPIDLCIFSGMCIMIQLS